MTLSDMIFLVLIILAIVQIIYVKKERFLMDNIYETKQENEEDSRL